MSKHFNNPVISWIDHRLPVFSYLDHEANEYPTPKNLNYWWNFGSLTGFMLITMIATGLFLAMQYTPHVSLAFNSVERIMRDVNYGWLLRYLHMNGASMFFIVVYIHIFRGLYFGSYKAPRELLWQIGVIILLLMMATSFTAVLVSVLVSALASGLLVSAAFADVTPSTRLSAQMDSNDFIGRKTFQNRRPKSRGELVRGLNLSLNKTCNQFVHSNSVDGWGIYYFIFSY